MPRILHREPGGLRLWGLPLGVPQSFAALLLVVFLMQALWLVQRLPISQAERAFVREGRLHWQQRRVAGGAERTPLPHMIAAAPVEVLRRGREDFGLEPVLRLARLPFVFIGLLLGASLWFVARRLYNNTGGYIALALFAFSPAIIAASAVAHPEIVAAWGVFGVVFTAIAATHSLYGPPEVALGPRNARRVGLLGVALALAVGSQFVTALAVPLAVVFMLYLVPGRRLTALAVLGAGLGVALLVLLAAYFFRVPALVYALQEARFVDFTPGLLAVGATWEGLLQFFARGAPAVLPLLVPAAAAYVAWRRSRYFGNSAPLLAALLLLLAALASAPQQTDSTSHLLLAMPFLFVFIAGVFSDLLEGAYRRPALLGLMVLIAFQAGYCLVAVARA
jgi:hypothetical protein